MGRWSTEEKENDGVEFVCTPASRARGPGLWTDRDGNAFLFNIMVFLITTKLFFVLSPL